MKKYFTLISLLITLQVVAQNYPVTGINISLAGNPDANTANWKSGTSLLTISATTLAENGRIAANVLASKILVTIKKGGVKVYGDYTINSAPASDFNTPTKIWKGDSAVSFLGKSFVLAPGDYDICVQFFGNGAAGLTPISEEKTKAFSISADVPVYQAPQLIAPKDGTVISESEPQKPNIFSWTSVKPIPPDPVTYRLMVWQLIQGQTGEQAMKANRPIIIKDVDNLIQTDILNLTMGKWLPPPYVFDYIWTVQALNREGKPIGENNGTSKPNKFQIADTIYDTPGTIPSFITQMENPTKSFLQIQSEADKYFDNIKLTNGGVITTEEKNYKRWQYFWKDRTSYPGVPYGGDFTKVMEYSNLLATNSINICNTGPSWQLAGPNTISLAHIGIVISVAVHPINSNIIFAGTNASGLWKTTNSGATWQNITDNLRIPAMGVSSIAIDPIDPNTIYISTGSFERGWTSYAVGVLKSIDGGLTWNPTSLSNSGPNGNKINVVKISPANSNNIYAAGGKTISKSNDSGSTWTTWTNTSNVTFRDLEFDGINSNIIYASTDVAGSPSAEFWVSMDGGITWNNRTPVGDISERISIAVTQADVNFVYLMYRIPATTDVNGNGLADDTYITIKKSSDNGNTWTTVSQIYNQVACVSCHSGALDNIGFWKNEFEISPYNASVMYAGGDILSKSTNGGLSFTACSQYWPSGVGANSTHADIRALSIISTTPGTDVLLIGHDGGIAISYNGGVLWNNINGSGLAITQFYGFDDFQNNNDLIGGTQDNGTLKGTSGIWTQTFGGDGSDVIVDDLNPNIVYSNANGFVYKSTDGGNTWGGLYNPNSGWYLGIPMYLDPTDHSKLWYGTRNLYYHNGTTWVLKWTNPYTYGTISALAVAKSNPDVMFLANSDPTWGPPLVNKFYKSINGGTSFTDISSTMVAYNYAGATDIAIDPKNENHIFVSFSSFWPDGSGTGGVYRVIESIDGGVTWNDMSNGLTPFPVNCLTYQEGTNDVIFAGTDVGVYRWNKTGLIWECYNKDLPVSIVTHLEINYCSSKIKASTFGRGIWEVDLAPVSAYHITQNQTLLSGTFNSFNNDVIVDPGKILTIKGTVSFAPGKRLIVMPNAKLIVDGGKLTNSCGGLWQGVEVVGNSSLPQTIVSGGLAIYQGVVEIKNDAIIEYAVKGITTGLSDDLGNYNFSTFGGIIFATKANFYNNHVDVSFMSYPYYNNKSYFRNCLFETTLQHRVSQSLSAHISIWNVKNIKILGCDFKYSAGLDYPVGNRATGILSIDAKYYVGDYCSSYIYPCPVASTKQSSFSDLDYGIYSFNGNPLLNANINHAVFYNNNYDGAYFRGMNYPSINNCSFDVGNNIPTTAGLYLDNCKYYSVQNNIFFTTNSGYIGIFVNDSKTGAHEIYNNKFTGLYSGIIPLRDNSGATNLTDGLAMHCNEFIGNTYDIAVTGTLPNNTIAFIQGITGLGSESLVRNRYSAPGINENQFFINSSSKYVIHASNSAPNTQPLPQPLCSDLLVLVLNSGIPFTDCQNKLLMDKYQLSAKMKQLANLASKLKDNYKALIDGGNTLELLNLINSTIGAGDLKDLLIRKSPYLSDEVLIAYVSKGSTPPDDLKDVIIANSPVGEVCDIIIENLDLPDKTKQEISNAQRGISERTKLEAQIIQTEFDRQLYISDKIRYFLNDTIDENSMDSVRYMLEVEPRPDPDCKQASNESDDFCKLKKLIIELNDCSRVGCRNAQALLMDVFNYQYGVLRMLPNDQHNLPLSITEEFENTNCLSVYPNPATQGINIIFSNSETPDGIIEIRDVGGRLIEKIQLTTDTPYYYNTESLNKAIYFISLFIDGKFIENKKIVLIK